MIGTHAAIRDIVDQHTEHLFRKEYARLVSVLTARYGRQRLEMVEDAVQEALLKAMQVWGFKGMPNAPSAWLFRVASNRLIDNIRRAKFTTFETDVPIVEEQVKPVQIEDDQLRMLFACCHPALKEQDQIILSLKILGGLHLKEIASALLKTEEAEDWRAATGAIREARGCLELLGKLAGELQQEGQTINVIVSPQWVELRTTIIEALEPHPDAKSTVLRALQGKLNG